MRTLLRPEDRRHLPRIKIGPRPGRPLPDSDNKELRTASAMLKTITRNDLGDLACPPSMPGPIALLSASLSSRSGVVDIGYTPSPLTGPFDIENLVADVVALIDELGGSPDASVQCCEDQSTRRRAELHGGVSLGGGRREGRFDPRARTR